MISDETYTSDRIKILNDQDLSRSITAQSNLVSSLIVEEQDVFKRQYNHYRLINANCSLEYYGAKHIFDPRNPQFNDLGNSLLAYLEGKDPQKVIVLVEGSIPVLYKNIEEDIRHNGERGFITCLAEEKGVQVACLEPDRVGEAIYLLKEFTPDQIEYYYYLRAVRDYFRAEVAHTDLGFEEYSRQLLEHHRRMYAKVSEFADFDFSLENMKRIHKDITGTDFDVNKRIDVNPRSSASVINSVSKACNDYRDFHHVRAIEKYLVEGFSVFVVNGEDHAVIQRPALESMFAE